MVIYVPSTVEGTTPSSHKMSRNSLTFVYRRRKQNANPITVCTIQPGAIVKPSHLMVAQEHTRSVPELVTEVNRSPVVHLLECNKGVRVYDGRVAGVEAGSEEALISDTGRVLNVCRPKDDCSSSKSYANLSSVLFRFDNEDACHRSSSGACINENAPAYVSGRDKFISILKGQGPCERLRVTHDHESAENTYMTGEKYCSKSCKFCENLESTSKMLICDDCEDSFHLSCCTPRIMRIPIGEWFCSSCLKKSHKLLKDISAIHSVNITNEFPRNEKSESEGELESVEFLSIDSEPHVSNVKIGDEFQADVPDWSDPTYHECDLIGDLLEIAPPNNLIMQEQNSVKTLSLSSIGNWLQCQEVIKGIGGVNGTICGKWRRALLFKVQTVDWGCFDSVNWDPTHSDCAVPQELGTEEVMKQLKYIEKLRSQLAAKRRKMDYSKTASSKDHSGFWCRNDGEL